MTTAPRVLARSVAGTLPGPGWCTPYAAAGVPRLAADPRSGRVGRDYLRRLPPWPATPGHLALVDVAPVPKLLQAAYETGIRVACSSCAAAGRDELGLPFRFADVTYETVSGQSPWQLTTFRLVTPTQAQSLVGSVRAEIGDARHQFVPCAVCCGWAL